MKKPLRALLLSAGLGTRLRPITLNTPKCLVDIGGKPLLSHWLNKLQIAGCCEVLINTHYLSEQVDEFINKINISKMSVKLFHESILLGTAGTLRANSKFFDNSTGLLIHADNAMEDDLEGLLNAHRHRPKGCLITMLTFKSNNPSTCGIVELDTKGIVKAFHEKVSNPPNDCANGAVYVFDYDFITFLKTLDPNVTDFSTEVLSKLIGKIYTWQTNSHFIDIGTSKRLLQAQEIWSNKFL